MVYEDDHGDYGLKGYSREVQDQYYLPVRSRDQYEYVVYSDLDERVLPSRPNTRFVDYHSNRCSPYHLNWLPSA